MKRKFIILVLITGFSICLIGCNNDDDVSYSNNSLNGTWNLISYGGGVTGQFEKYNKSEITWRFDTINNTVLIKSKLDYFGPKSGNYPYELRQDDENKTLYLNDSVQGLLYINEDELAFGGFIIATFKR